MKVFISWSGDQSRKLADFLASWLKKLPLAIEPWVSKDAIDPGTRWGKELAEALEGTSFGILCITSENQREPWINFEAGAVSKTIEKSYVVPYLIGMKPSELEQPLKQFQAIEANEEDTWKLIETIYRASGDTTRTLNDLEESFKMWWQKLSEQIEHVKKDIMPKMETKTEPDMSDIKLSLDKVLTFLESLSSRLLERERSTQEYEAIKGAVYQKIFRDYFTHIPSVKDDIERSGASAMRDFIRGYKMWEYQNPLANLIKEKSESQESDDKEAPKA